MNIIKQFSRREYKYLVDASTALEIGRYLKFLGLKPDSFSATTKNQSYYVASLYLDTPNYQAYWDKKYGVALRTKHRLRTYCQKSNSSIPIYWEVKKKYGDFFKKDRFPVTVHKTQLFLDQQINLDSLLGDGIDRASTHKFYASANVNRFAPAVLISYLRQPWVDSFYSDFRLTFDYQIEAVATRDLFYPSRQAQILPGYQIMEVKFSGRVPRYLEQINHKFNLERQSLSKYCLSLEACGIVNEEKISVYEQ